MNNVKFWHIAALAFAAVAYLAIFTVTGDSDLFFAISAGAFGVIATWLFLLPKFLAKKHRSGV